MAQSGSDLLTGTLTASAGQPLTTLGPYVVGSKIAIGIDVKIVNGATAPTNPAYVLVEYRRDSSSTEWKQKQIDGPTTNNGEIDFQNIPIDVTVYDYRIRYAPGDDQDVTMVVSKGDYTV